MGAGHHRELGEEHKVPKLYLSVFDCGLISKWDHALPRTRRFTSQEGCPVTIELTTEQVNQIEAARQIAAQVNQYDGKVKIR